MFLSLSLWWWWRCLHLSYSKNLWDIIRNWISGFFWFMNESWPLCRHWIQYKQFGFGCQESQVPLPATAKKTDAQTPRSCIVRHVLIGQSFWVGDPQSIKSSSFAKWAPTNCLKLWGMVACLSGWSNASTRLCLGPTGETLSAGRWCQKDL